MGRLIVKLWASSNALDTDFTAKLVDAYPPNADFPAGVDLNVADSIVRARYRNGFGKAELLNPGQSYEFAIEMYPTSLVFKRGTGFASTSRAATSRGSTSTQTRVSCSTITALYRWRRT